MKFTVKRKEYIPPPIEKVIIELNPEEINDFILIINYASMRMPYKTPYQSILLQNLENSLDAIRYN